MNTPRFIQRLLRRNTCGDTATPTWVAPSPPVRPVEKCAEPSSPAVQEFIELVAEVPASPVLRRAVSVTLQNLETTVACADISGGAPLGDAVTIPAGEVTRRLFWSQLPTSLLPSQLDHLVDVDDLEDLTLAGVTVSEVVEATRLTPTQATEFLDLCIALRLEIDVEVRQDAVAALQCVWESEAVELDCPAGAAVTDYNGGAIAAGVKNPVSLDAGAATSTVSQAAANAAATALATSELVCLYPNAELTLACTDIGYPTTVPNDLISDAPLVGRLRRGEVTIPAGTYFSTTQAEADDRATEAATLALSCFYVNEAVVVSCEDNVPTQGASENPRNYSEGLTGNPITVNPGVFLSEGDGASQGAANELAADAAAALLVCQFFNTRQVVVCPVSSTPGVELSTDDVAREFVIEAGVYSSTSVEEANELARVSGLLQMNCQYCNAYIPPSCYPEDYTVEPGEAIPAGDVTLDWATNVVLGIAANTYCSSVPELVLPLAQAVAYQRPLPQDEGCVYVNDEMWFGCMLALPGSPELPSGGYWHPAYSDAALEDHPRYPGMAFTDKLSAESTPSPTLGALSYLKIPAGSYPVSTNDVPEGQDPKEYANAQAKLYGLALLSCSFTNPADTWTCENAWSPARFDQATIAQDPVISVTLPKGRHNSLVSFADAVAQANAAAIGSLDCYYLNDRVEVSCWPEFGISSAPVREVTNTPDVFKYGDGTAYYRRYTEGVNDYSELVELQIWQLGSLDLPAVAPAGTERSDISKADANNRALQYATSLLECAGQAREAGTFCSDRMVIRCGGAVEPNPAHPYRAGTNDRVDANWIETNGKLVIGDGHNYVMSQGKVATGVWALTDLGCSDDPIGGCKGTGISIPPCVMTAETRDAANALVYALFRTQLSCQGENIPELGGNDDEGGAGQVPPCMFAFHIRKSGVAYAVCPGNVYPASSSATFKTANAILFTTGGTRYVILTVKVESVFQNGWLSDFTILEAALSHSGTAPAPNTAQAGSGTFRYLVGTVAGGVVTQSVSGDVTLLGFSSGNADSKAIYSLF